MTQSRPRPIAALAVSACLAAAAPCAFADAFIWTLDPTSELTVTVSATNAFGTRTDTDKSLTAGMLSGELALPAYPFSQIHLTGVDARLLSDLSFTLSYGFFGSIEIQGQQLKVGLPGAHNLGVAGPPALVAADGTFNQTGNTFEANGTMNYQGTGVVGAAVGPGTIDLVDQSPIPGDLPGRIQQVGNQLTLSAPLNVTQTSTEADTQTTFTITLTGTLVARATTTASGWSGDASGDWADAARWSGGRPGITAGVDTAVFGPVITAPRTVTLASDLTLDRLILAAPQSYTIAGAGSLTLAGASGNAIRVDSGSHTLATRLRLSGFGERSINVAAGASLDAPAGVTAVDPTVTYFRKDGDGTLRTARLVVGDLRVAGGTLELHEPASTLPSVALGTLFIDGPTSRLDLGRGALVVNASGSSGGPGTVLAYLRSAYNNGAWDGPGLTSSDAPPAPGTGVGWARADAIVGAGGGNWLGENVDPSAVLIRFTARGDTDLDRGVDFDDLLALAQNYGPAGTGKTWRDGDSNYDGIVDFDDLLALAQNYGQTLAAARAGLSAVGLLDGDFAADFALAQSLVPEPLALGGIVLANIVGRRRRAVG